MAATVAHVPRPPSGPPAPGPDTPQRHSVRAPRVAPAGGQSAADAAAAAVAAVEAEAVEERGGQAQLGVGDACDKIRELQNVGAAARIFTGSLSELGVEWIRPNRSD